MKISRELAIKILKYLDKHRDFLFPFLVMCREYSDEDNDFVEIEPDEWMNIQRDNKYQTFELWENLQNLNEEILKLMSKGFIEKITKKNSCDEIKKIAKKYRGMWKEELWESEDIEKFGENEYFGGKAEGFEESLEILRNNGFLGRKIKKV